MSARGSLVIRLVLFITAILLFCVLGYIGLGWALWSDQPWLRKMIGSRRMDRWHTAYAYAAGVLLPQDRDGDGVSDGIELFLHTDPQRPSEHPPLYLIFEHGDFQAMDLNEVSDLSSFRRNMESMVQPGERIPIRGRLIVSGFSPDHHPPFPRNFRLRLNPPAFASLALPGGPPVPGPLTIPVPHDGTIAFDLQVSSDSASGASSTGTVVFTNAATNETLFHRDIRCIWAKPAFEPRMEVIQPTGRQIVYARLGDLDPRKLRFVQLSWPTTAATEPHTLVEVARDEEGAKWFQLYLHPYGVTSCVVAQDLSTNPLHSYNGPLKFRVIPLRFVPP